MKLPLAFTETIRFLDYSNGAMLLSGILSLANCQSSDRACWFIVDHSMTKDKTLDGSLPRTIVNLLISIIVSNPP